MTLGSRLAATLAAAAIALAAIGCGDDEQAPTTSSTTPTTAAATGPTGAEGASESAGSAELEEIKTNLLDDGWKLMVEFDGSDYTLSEPQPIGGFRVEKTFGSTDAEIDVQIYESDADAEAGAEDAAKDYDDEPDQVETVVEAVGPAIFISWPLSDDEERAAFAQTVEAASAG